jgi:hypothetical protein
MSAPFFRTPQAAALSLLTAGKDLNQKQGQFLGGLAFSAPDYTLSEKQNRWLRDLLRKNGMPTLEGGG